MRVGSAGKLSIALISIVMLVGSALYSGSAAAQSPAEEVDQPQPATPDDSYTPLPEETFYVQTRGGAVFVRLQRPDVPDGMKVPVILNFTVYHEGPAYSNGFEAQQYVDNGYAAAIADVPGTGESGGCFDLFGRRTQDAAYDLVEALASKGGEEGWFNGKVAMHGISANGGVEAVMAAAAHPPHLATIVSIGGAVGSVYEALYHDGVPYSGTDPAQPAGAGPNQAAAVLAALGTLPPSDALGEEYPGRASQRVCAETNEKLKQIEHGNDLEPDYDAFWRERDFAKDAWRLGEPSPETGMTVSALTIGSWRDTTVKSSLYTRWFEAIPENVPFKMLFMGTQGHGFHPGHTTDTSDQRSPNLIHAWFDRFLYGYDTGIEELSPVWSTGNSWRSVRDYELFEEESAWPPVGSDEVKLFLGGSGNFTGSLSLKPGRGESALGSWTDTGVVTESEVVTWRHRAAGKETKDFLWFETAPLERDVRIAGAPSLQLVAATSKTSTHFTPVLFDVGPVQDVTWLGAPCLYPVLDPQDLDGLSQVEVRGHFCAASRGFLNARYKDGLEQGSDLAPGERYRASIRFLDQDWTVPAGHKIGVALMSSNAWWAMPDQERAENSISSESGAFSALVLPVVGGEQALDQALG